MSGKKQIEAAIGRMILAGMTPIRVIGTHPPHFQLSVDHRFVLLPARNVSGQWEARISTDMLSRLRSFTAEKDSLFDQWSLVLICDEELCWLYEEEWRQLIGTDRRRQTIVVRRPENCSFRVWSKADVLHKTIPLNRFSSLAQAA